MKNLCKSYAVYLPLVVAYSLCLMAPALEAVEGGAERRDRDDLYDKNRRGRTFSEYDYGTPKAELERDRHNHDGYFYRFDDSE